MTEEEQFINENKVDLVGLVKHKLRGRNLTEIERFELAVELEQSQAAAAFEKTRKIRRE